MTELTRRFGEHLALDSMTLRIAAGEIVCLLGANGAGKTTTIHLVLGLLAPTSGRAAIDGIIVADDPVGARQQLAFVPEQVALYPRLTGLENLTFFTRLAGRDGNRAELVDLLGMVGLDKSAIDRPAATYSKGMRQKVGLAIALAKKARALLLDEPLSGLDPSAAGEFARLLRSLADGGLAVLMATHDLFRAREIADRIGIMKRGRLVEVLDTKALDPAALESVYLEHMRLEPGESN